MFICTRLMDSSPPATATGTPCCCDAAGGERDRLQARGAEAVDGLRRRRHRQAGADGALAGDVAAGGAFGVGAAHHHVLDVAGLDAGALDGVGDHVAAHVGAVGEVEGAAHGSADRRAGGGDDDGVDHGVGSFFVSDRVSPGSCIHGHVAREAEASRQSAGKRLGIRVARRQLAWHGVAHSAAACLRCRSSAISSFFDSLPTAVFGRASRNSRCAGSSCRPSLSARNARSSSSVKALGAGLQLHERLGRLAAIGVGHADHDHLGDARDARRSPPRWCADRR